MMNEHRDSYKEACKGRFEYDLAHLFGPLGNGVGTEQTWIDWCNLLPTKLQNDNLYLPKWKRRAEMFCIASEVLRGQV